MFSATAWLLLVIPFSTTKLLEIISIVPPLLYIVPDTEEPFSNTVLSSSLFVNTGVSSLVFTKCKLSPLT